MKGESFASKVFSQGYHPAKHINKYLRDYTTDRKELVRRARKDKGLRQKFEDMGIKIYSEAELKEFAKKHKPPEIRWPDHGPAVATTGRHKRERRPSVEEYV